MTMSPLVAQEERPVVPPAVRQLVGEGSGFFGERADWGSWLRPDGDRVWLGTRRSQPLDREFVLVMETRPPHSRVWLISRLDGRLTADNYPRVVLDRDDLIVLDMIGGDYGWVRDRVVIYLDREAGITRRVVAPVDLERVYWTVEDSVPTIVVESSDRKVRAARLETAITAPRLRGLPSAEVLETFSPRPPGRGRDSAISNPVVLPGDPEVLVDVPEGRFGVRSGAETLWTAIPAPSDSLKSLAWRGEDFDLENSLSPAFRDGDRVFAGTSFYSGEGTNGVGGVAEFSPRSRTVRMHYWRETLNWSTEVMKVSGDTLWLEFGASLEGESSTGGLFVVRIGDSEVLRLDAPDVIRSYRPFRDLVLLESRRAVGVLRGRRITWWIPVPGERGSWRFIEWPGRPS